MFRFKRTQKLVQEPQTRIAKISQCGMDVNGVKRKDRRQAAGKAGFHRSQAGFQGKLRLDRRFEIDRTVQMQNPVCIKMWRQRISRSVLRNPDTVPGPCPMRVLVRAIAWSTRRTGNPGEDASEDLYRRIDQTFLLFPAKKTVSLRLLWIPVFKPHPRHAPMNVWQPGVPHASQQNTSFTRISEVAFYRSSTKMSCPMQCGGEYAGFNTFPVRVKQAGTIPSVGKSLV